MAVSSCADHNIAWRVRPELGMDKVPAGVTNKNNDAIIYDFDKHGQSGTGFGHPKCGGKEVEVAEKIGASASGAAPFKNAAASFSENRPNAEISPTNSGNVPEPGLSRP